MLTNFIDKIKNLPDIYYVFAAFVFLLVVAHIIFLVVNNRLNKRDLLTKEKEGVRETYILEVLFEKDLVRIYSKKNYKKVYSYTMDQMFDLIQYSDLDDWKKWINNIKKGKVSEGGHIIVRIINPANSKASLVRIVFEQYNLDKKSIFFNFEIINVDLKTSSIDVPSLMNPNEFKKKIDESGFEKKNTSGTFMIFELTTVKSILKRFGNTVSNECLFEIMRRFKDIMDDTTHVSYFGLNSFYIFKKGIITKTDAIELMKNIYDAVGSEEIYVNKYVIMPHFNVGISVLGEYTFDSNELIRNAKLALTQANNKYETIKYGYYDYSNETVNIKYRQNSDKLRNLLSHDKLNLVFEPMVSLSSLSIFGYYARFDRSFSEDDGFQTYLQVAKSLNLKDELITKFVVSMLDKCVNEMRKRSRVLFKVNIEDLELVKNIILSNQEYMRLKIVLVLDYEQLLKEENASIVKSVYEETYDNSLIDFAVIADENMITVYSNVLSLCSFIILDEFMVSNIEVDDLKHIATENIIENTTAFSGIQFISRGVKKYEQARNLQEMGIMAISGPYVLEPTSDLQNTNFLKNRTIQRLYDHE